MTTFRALFCLSLLNSIMFEIRRWCAWILRDIFLLLSLKSAKSLITGFGERYLRVSLSWSNWAKMVLVRLCIFELIFWYLRFLILFWLRLSNWLVIIWLCIFLSKSSEIFFLLRSRFCLLLYFHLFNVLLCKLQCEACISMSLFMPIVWL